MAGTCIPLPTAAMVSCDVDSAATDHWDEEVALPEALALVRSNVLRRTEKLTEVVAPRSMLCLILRLSSFIRKV